MNKPIDDVFLANSHAIDNINKGNEKKAISDITEALHLFSARISRQEKQANHFKRFALRRGKKMDQNNIVLLYSVSLEKKNDQLPQTRRSSSSDSDDGTLFNRAFVLIDHNKSPYISHKKETQVAAVLLFNIALAHHRRGDAASLRKALKLYHRAFTVLEDFNLEVDDPLVSVLMAICINMASIHSTFCNLDELKRTEAIFLRVFNWAGVAPCNEEEVSFFGFLAFVLKNQRLISAAAA